MPTSLHYDATPATPEGALSAGIDAAHPEAAREAREVQRWADRITRTRKHDEHARQQYARDRRYARGDSGFDVDANIIGTFADILTAFLYAQDPAVDVLPAKSSEPPSLEALRDAAEVDVDQDPRLAQAGAEAANAGSWVALALGQQHDPALSIEAAHIARAQMRETIIAERIADLQATYRKRQRDNKAFADTLELVISALWRKGLLKPRAKAMVRSALTIGVGWLKASWQQRAGQDPLTRQQIADLRDNIAKAAALRAQLDEDGADAGPGLVARAVGAVRGWLGGDAREATEADYRAQLAALESKAEVVLARGFAIDFVPGEDMTVAPGVELPRYLDAPWLDHRIPMLVEDIVAEFKLDAAAARKITRYRPRKPETQRNESPGVAQHLNAKDADGFVEGDEDEGVGAWGMVHETWDRDANAVRTWIEGVPRWARPPAAPTATSRFYGFFLLAIGEIDGERHPQSLVARSAKLVEEYNRIGSAERTHRQRVQPKTVFLRGQVDADNVTRVVNAGTGEFVGIDVTQLGPDIDVNKLFMPLQYPQLDPALYDRSRIIAELERVWGVQEALAGGITVNKTATEAQIQQSGMQARTGAQRDALEDVFTELALYTAEVALAVMEDEDVRAIVGPTALWPAIDGPDHLARLVNVEIRAGSSGKPNTTAEREAWAALLPLLQGGIQRIGALRMSTPADMADAEEALLRMTVERSGDRIDLESLLPKAGPMTPALPGAPGAPGPGGSPLMPDAGGPPSEPAAPVPAVLPPA